MDEDKKENSFKININSGIIIYNDKGLEKLSNKDEIILSVNDPLGNNVVLWNSTFKYHILEERNNDSRHYFSSERNMSRLEYGISNPMIILEDKNHKNRLEFISLVDLEANGEVRLKGLTIITEQSSSILNAFEIVTAFPRSRISQDITDRRVVYHVNNNIDRT